MKKEMLINVLQPEECRIAIVEDGVLEELYVERASQESYVGNIYKGRIVNIEPSIQAAFVDFGIGRNGFLHVSDVDPVYFKHLLPADVREQLEAEENGDYSHRTEARRGRDRSDRGERPDRSRDRGPRVTIPESALTIPTAPSSAPSIPIPPLGYVEDEDAAEFGAGLIDLIPDPHTDSPEISNADTNSPEFAVQDTENADWPTPETVENTEESAAENSLTMEPESGTNEPVMLATPSQPSWRIDRPQPQSVAIDEEDDEPFAVGLDLGDEPDAAASEGQSEDAPTQDAVTDCPTGQTGADLITESDATGEMGDDPWGVAASEKADLVQGENPVVEAETDVVEDVAEVLDLPPLPDESPSGEDKPAKPRGRSRTRKAKEATDADKPGSDSEPKKPRTRRPRKKADEESREESNLQEPGTVPEPAPTHDTLPPDAEPRIMGGPERRTSAGDEEPEIQPFFEGASDDFDVEGPNDRFASTEDFQDSEESGFATAVIESDETSNEDNDATADTDAGLVDDSDDDEFAPPRRSFDDDDEEGGRSLGRSRGRRRNGKERSTRSGPSSRDRVYPRPPIQEIFKRGQEVIVQVIKEGIGTKGPTLSTFISIAGRYLVLMPSLNRVGVSRKIEDPEARRRLRDIMNDLNPPKGVGFIVRTAAVDRNETELQNDLAYLLRLWQVVVRRIKRMPAPVEIYRESDMITRTIRDIFTNDIDTIYVDEEHAFAHASEFLQIVMPRFASRIRYYGDSEPLFHKYRIEEEIAKINQKRLDLPGGGSIIIEQTEALVAIDVNSGTFRAENNAEETAFQMNLRAAKEIARQLRLRDLGGVIVNDFIDMRDEKHRRRVEDALRDALKRDRARTKILRISQFGIIEMTRQRIQPSLKKRIFDECSHCNGTGYVKTQETMGIEVMRLLQLAAHRTPQVAQVTLTVHIDVAFYLLNRKRKELARLEERAKMEVLVQGQYGVSPEHCEFKCFDANGNEVRLYGAPPMKMFAPGTRPRAILERRYPQPID